MPGDRAYKAIEVEGLKEFRNGLRLMGPAYVKTLRVELKAAGELVRSGAASLTPVGHRPKPAGIKHLNQTLKTRVSGDTVAIFSPSPYANVIHWGGNVPNQRSASLRPKRAFKATKFTVRAMDEHAEQLQRNLLAAVENVARQHGFH